MSKNYVFVVGAGASKEFDLPTGAELKSKIAGFCTLKYSDGFSLSEGDYRVAETLRKLVQKQNSANKNINPYLYAGWQIADGMALAWSIDNFLDTHRNEAHVVKFGKLAVAGCIREAEKNSKLWFDERTDPNGMRLERVKDTWIGQLFSLFAAGRDFQAFLEILTRTTFIVFNYDRCIEHFLTNASRRYFNLTNAEVQMVVDALNIRRPYGAIGNYHLKSGGFSSDFGEEVFGEKLIQVSDGLRTFTEGAATDFQERVADDLAEANYVFFLGFGFIPLNMNLLLGNDRTAIDGLYGTAKGLSEHSRKMVEQQLAHAFAKTKFPHGGYNELGSERLKLSNFTCADLIYEYQRLLT